MALTIGTRLGPFEVVGSLGAGGMGEVYRAIDTRLGRTVAIKVLPPDLAADPERRRRFQQEARSVSALSHPHICALYDIGFENGIDFLVMEYLEGRTLAQHLASGRGLPLAEALEYGIQVADALAKAHRQGVVHRDIKPANVMLTKEGAKLLDFGLAKSKRPVVPISDSTLSLTRDSNTEPGVVVGTFPYMSPEQLEGREVDARTDIFAFGAMLYEMVSGRRAFAGSSQASIIAAIMTRDPAPLSVLVPVTPPSLDRLVRQCLAKDPDKRWQSAGDLARQLEWIAEELRTRSSDSSQENVQPGSATVPGIRGRKRLVATGLALVFFSVLVAATSFIIGHRMSDRPTPLFTRLTFRRGTVDGARFTYDGKNILFTARWDGNPRQVFSVRIDSVDATLRDGLQGMNVLAVSSRDELALQRGLTLAKVPLTTGMPHDLLSGVTSADWNQDGSQMAVTRGNTVEYPIGNVIYKSEKTVGDVRISPKSDLLALREHEISHGRVVLIDTAGHKKRESTFFDGIYPPAWTPDGREVWFSVSVPRGRIAVRALDLAGHERNVLTDPVMRLKDISRDGRVLLSAEDDSFSINGRGPGSTAERNLTWYNWSLLDDMSIDGRNIVFTEGGESDRDNGWSTFVRSTDGSPPQRFDEIIYAKLSPDGKYLAGTGFDKDGAQVKIVPTGAGDSWFVTHGTAGGKFVDWLADSSGVVYYVHDAAKPDAPDRVWFATLDRRPATPVTPDGWFGRVMGPVGSYVLALPSAPGDVRMLLYSVNGREKILLPGVTDAKWFPIGWDPDGKRMRAIPRPFEDGPLRIFRVDPMTGNAQLWKELGGQLERAGLWPISRMGRIQFSADGESYAYGYRRTLSTLYVVEGLK